MATNPEKQVELVKYRDLIIATIQYSLNNDKLMSALPGFDMAGHYKLMLTQTDELIKKGRLSVLKQWLRDLTEKYIEVRDVRFGKYLKDNFGYDIFETYFKKVESIILKGKITTDNQFYDISMMVDHLCQTQPVDNAKIEALNNLLFAYAKKKAKVKFA